MGFLLRWLACCRACALGCAGFSSCRSGAPEHRLDSCGPRPGCSATCGISQDQGLSLCLLHWQADSLLLSHLTWMDLKTQWQKSSSSQMAVGSKINTSLIVAPGRMVGPALRALALSLPYSCPPIIPTALSKKDCVATL